jgi:hypothetical protein
MTDKPIYASLLSLLSPLAIPIRIFARFPFICLSESFLNLRVDGQRCPVESHRHRCGLASKRVTYLTAYVEIGIMYRDPRAENRVKRER